MSVKVFGVPLDPLDTLEHLGAKLAGIAEGIGKSGAGNADPYTALTALYADLLARNHCRLLGQVGVEGFLRPRPPPQDALQVTQTDYGVFLDTGGCLEYAGTVRDFVRSYVLPDPFMMLGVDHSSTGGALAALADEAPVLVVLDAHHDGVDPTVKMEFSRYWMEARPREYARLGISEGSYAAMRSVAPGSYYACGNFLERAIAQGWAAPERTCLVGLTDYPDRRLSSVSDSRVKAYVDAYQRFERQGMTFLTAEALRHHPEREFAHLSRRVEGRPVYVSVDLDVAAGAGAAATRFPITDGLDRTGIGRLVEWLAGLPRLGVRLLGADIMELDVHAADSSQDAGRTYRVAGRFMAALVGAFDGT